jgi:hypothetical protein
MTEEEKELIRRYGIVVSHKSEYTYKGFKYERLRDALNYATIEADRQHAAKDASA